MLSPPYIQGTYLYQIHCVVPENTCIHTLRVEGHWKFRREGVLKTNIFEGKYEA